jgi:hypothetical protein
MEGIMKAILAALVTGRGNDVLVCRYAPMGKVVGEKPY